MISYAWSPLGIIVPLPIRLVYHYFVIHHSYCCAALALAPICNFWSSFLVNTHLDRLTVSFNKTLKLNGGYPPRLRSRSDLENTMTSWDLLFNLIQSQTTEFNWVDISTSLFCLLLVCSFHEYTYPPLNQQSAYCHIWPFWRVGIQTWRWMMKKKMI